MPIAPIDDVLAALRRGEMIILVDDEDRENEGDLCMVAELVTPEHINFMARFGRGLVCLAMTPERLSALEIPMMVQDNTSRLGTAFTVSIEAATGVTTGISAADRARTIQVAVADTSRPSDLARPGHIFPLAAKDGGVLVRTGQTEGSVDLARLAGFKPAAVICEIMKDDGEMARMPDLERFAEEHGLLISTVADIIEYRLTREGLVEKVFEAPCPTVYSPDFRVHVFRNRVDGTEHLALTLGEIDASEPVLVRVHSGSTVGDVLGAVAMDGGERVPTALRQIARAGRGVFLYISRAERPLSWEVRNILRAEPVAGSSAAQSQSEIERERAINTPAPQLRLFGIGAQCLRALGVGPMRLITNNQRKIVGLEAYGLHMVERVPLADPRD